MIQQSYLPVSKTAKLLEVETRGYYKWNQRKEPPDPNFKLRKEIHKVALEFPKYGYRRITHALRRQGKEVNHKRILGLMREEHSPYKLPSAHVLNSFS